MHEHETLMVLEALMKWEDKLLGRKFTVVTDHKGLEYLADSLSRYYEYDTIEDEYPNSEFIKADEILDPDGDLVSGYAFSHCRFLII